MDRRQEALVVGVPMTTVIVLMTMGMRVIVTMPVDMIAVMLMLMRMAVAMLMIMMMVVRVAFAVAATTEGAHQSTSNSFRRMTLPAVTSMRVLPQAGHKAGSSLTSMS